MESLRFLGRHGKDEQQEQSLFERPLSSVCQTAEFRTILPFWHLKFRLLGIFTGGYANGKLVVTQVAEVVLEQDVRSLSCAVFCHYARFFLES